MVYTRSSENFEQPKELTLGCQCFIRLIATWELTVSLVLTWLWFLINLVPKSARNGAHVCVYIKKRARQGPRKTMSPVERLI